MDENHSSHKKNSSEQNGNRDHGFDRPHLLPPILFLMSAAAILLFGYMETGQFGQSYMGLIVTTAAFFSANFEKSRFAKHGTTIFPGSAASSLLTDGMFRYSRNPMYLAMVVGLMGIWPVTGGYSPLAIILAFTAHIHHRFILREEAHLRALFGEEYEAYCRKVRRWI